MLRFIILFCAILLTIIFANYKYSTAIRIIAFHEAESKTNAIYAFILMFVIALLWTIILF